jgi:hypothetical protein
MRRLREVQPQQVLAAASIVIATGVLALLLRDTVRDVIVLPLAYLLWLADLFLKSIPQAVFLGVLVVAAALLASRGFGRSREEPETHSVLIEGRRDASRLSFWARQFDHCEDSAFASEKLAEELRDLILNILASRERSSPEDVLSGVRNGAVAVPSNVRELLIQPHIWLAGAQGAWFSHVMRRVKAWLRLPERTAEDSALDTKLEGIVHYIEAQIGGAQG